MAISPFRSFVLKETRHILRDRRTLTVLLMLPIVMVMLFGYAIRTDVTGVKLMVVDLSRDARSETLTRALGASPALQLVRVESRIDQVEPSLRNGEAAVALIIPVDFARTFALGTADVQVVSDGANANYASTAENYLRTVIRGWAADNGGRTPQVRVATRMRFNPTLESENLFVPGLLAFVLMIVSALMTAISLAREKETGTLEILLVSPLRPIQIVIGKITPYLALAFVNALTALGLAYIVFGVPIRGSLLLLMVGSLLYVLVSLALGVLISSRAPDQRTAQMAVLMGLMLPTLALSGFIFPISSAPAWLQPVTNVVPATWFIIIARGIMLKGVGLTILWKEFLILGGMAIALVFVASRAFSDRLG